MDLPKEFDEDSYGGVQEVISMGIIKTTLQRAVNQGLFNQELNKQYEVPYFQFFMGDLGNFVDYANKLPAHDPFTISCEFAQDRASELKTVRFDEHDLYIQGPEDCSITYNSAVIMKVSFDMNLVVRFVIFCVIHLDCRRELSQRQNHKRWSLRRQVLQCRSKVCSH